MTQEIQKSQPMVQGTELIIEPSGPQGGKIGLNIPDAETLQKFDEAVGALPEAERKNLNVLRNKALELGIQIID